MNKTILSSAILGVLCGATALSQGDTGVLAHYTFDGSLTDSSGNGLDGTSPRPPSFSLDALFGESASFSYLSRTLVQVADNPLFHNLDSMTVAFWAKPTSWPTSPRFYQKGNDFDSRFQAPGGLEFSNNGTNFQFGNRTTLVPVGQWTHLAAVVDGPNSLLSVYVNGNQVGSHSYTGGVTNVTAPFLIGAKQNSPTSATGDHFDGLMDEFWVIGSALDATQINTLSATNTIPDFPPPPPPPPPPPGTAATLEISALIDGRDQLIIHRNTLQWHHLDAAAVGRWQGANQPTILTTTIGGDISTSGLQWIPDWSQPPPNEIRFQDYSSIFTGLDAALPDFEQSLVLDPIQVRSGVSIVQQPSAVNDFTAIVEFNDLPAGGATTYDLKIGYQIVPEPTSAVSLLLVGGALLGLRRNRKTR